MAHIVQKQTPIIQKASHNYPKKVININFSRLKIDQFIPRHKSPLIK